MTRTRSLLMVMAGSAGLLAAILLMTREAPKPQIVEKMVSPSGAPAMVTTDVLVAVKEVPLGATVKAGDFTWKPWPKDGLSPTYIRRDEKGMALEELRGAIVRQGFGEGEPVRLSKLIKSDGSGYMSAILPSGMRAVSITISAETGAGGFILPNDRVDVILSRRRQGNSNNGNMQNAISETILTNVRVLAIDQVAQEKENDRAVLGRTATLELTPKQAEMLAMSRATGDLSLALRSLADRNEKAAIKREDGGSMSVVKYGYPSRVSVTNQ